MVPPYGSVGTTDAGLASDVSRRLEMRRKEAGKALEEGDATKFKKALEEGLLPMDDMVRQGGGREENSRRSIGLMFYVALSVHWVDASMY